MCSLLAYAIHILYSIEKVLRLYKNRFWVIGCNIRFKVPWTKKRFLIKCLYVRVARSIVSKPPNLESICTKHLFWVILYGCEKLIWKFLKINPYSTAAIEWNTRKLDVGVEAAGRVKTRETCFPAVSCDVSCEHGMSSVPCTRNLTAVYTSTSCVK